MLRAHVLWVLHRPSNLFRNLERLIELLLAPETKEYQLQEKWCFRLRSGT